MMKEPIFLVKRSKHCFGMRRRFIAHLSFALMIGAIFGFGYVLLQVGHRARLAEPTTFAEVLSLPAEQLTGCDLALMNLLCTEDLPCAEGLEMHTCLSRLDAYAQRVAAETQRNLHRFLEHPQDYENSEAYYRMGMLITVLQQDCGVRYNPARIESPDAPTPNAVFFADSSDIFLPGLLCARRMGSCASMPVLYTAVARRLGYPVKLVTAKAHLFVRWESPDGKERLNIEGTNQGIRCEPDDYYKTWPLPISAAEIEACHYLQALTPAEELAVFLSLRGLCLQSAGRLAEARQSFARARELAPYMPIDASARAGDRNPALYVGQLSHPPAPRPEEALNPSGVETLAAEIAAINQHNRERLARAQPLPRLGQKTPGSPYTR